MTDKPKISKSNFSVLWWVVKLQWKSSPVFVVWKLIHSVYDGIGSIINIYLVAQLFSSVTQVAFSEGTSSSVYRWLVLLLVFQLIDVALREVTRLAERRFDQQLELTFDNSFFTTMYGLSQVQFDDEEFNIKLSRAQEGLRSMQRSVNELSWVLESVIRFASSIIGIIIAAPFVGIIIAIVVAPLGFLGVKQNNITEKMFREVDSYDRIAYRSRWLLLDRASMPEIRIINAFQSLVDSWRKNLTKSHKISFAAQKRMFVYSMVDNVVEPVISFGATLRFFQMLASGAMGFDQFVFLRGLLAQATTSVRVLSNSVERLHEITINLSNIQEITNMDPAVPVGTKKVSPPLSIEFKNVTFSYPGSKEKALDDVSFKIVPGSQLALVGENGAGKTTLIKLLLRQYLPDSGEIIINGHSIVDIDQESYYRSISNLSQNFLVIQHLTIKENLLAGIKGAITDTKIYEVTDMVEATGFISKLPNKLKHRLDSSFKDGSQLSGGQLQRLGVARAILRKGDLLILDEPTSAIDAKAEYAIFNNIYKMHGNRSTLIISHRFSTVRKAEMIIVMEKGKIIEYGSHKELLAYGGQYKDMFETQAEGYR